jgi:hypothetical protein
VRAWEDEGRCFRVDVEADVDELVAPGEAGDPGAVVSDRDVGAFEVEGERATSVGDRDVVAEAELLAAGGEVEVLHLGAGREARTDEGERRRVGAACRRHRHLRRLGLGRRCGGERRHRDRADDQRQRHYKKPSHPTLLRCGNVSISSVSRVSNI